MDKPGSVICLLVASLFLAVAGSAIAWYGTESLGEAALCVGTYYAIAAVAWFGAYTISKNT